MCFNINKPTPLYITQNPDLFLTYKGGFTLQTGKRYPLQLPEGEQYDKLSTQLISGKVIHGKKIIFPALNSSNIFAFINYEAHKYTKIDYYFSQNFKTM